jgi:glycosyltransferase involved in cell wall biosynthesis
MPKNSETLLCVTNFSPNIGYAWDFIEHLYAKIADHLSLHGIRTLVAYPDMPSFPRTLIESTAGAIALDVSLNSMKSIWATVKFIHRENVQVIYFSDRQPWRLAYLLLRLAGVRHIIVHDHSSGERTRPRGLKCAAKWLVARAPCIVADVIIAVSDYVARRHVEVGLIPSRRVVRVWNGIYIARADREDARDVRTLFGLESNRTVIVCACRASEEKGIVHLLHAFDRLAQNLNSTSIQPTLVYVGDGPQMNELRLLRKSLASQKDIILAGYRTDVASLLKSADLCVIPSVWQEAFSLAVIEPMAYGKPIIATSVGAIPELIEHNVTGLLVPPTDVGALAKAMHDIIIDPLLAMRLGEAGRRHVIERFSLEQQILRLTTLVEEGFEAPCKKLRDPILSAR